MARVSRFVVSSLSLAQIANGQVYFGEDRTPDAFTYIQPLNTTILGQNGHSEPVYPSPNITGAGGWEEAINKARAFVSELTLDEKSEMVTGVPGPCVGNIYPIPRLNFTGICFQDGPVQIRTTDFVSLFPSGVNIAATWDRAMMYAKHLAMGREFRAKGAHVALAPSTGPLGRCVYGGRNWEGFSPDPYLSGIAMELGVRGLQDAGVQSVPKHFIANEQETLRNPLANTTTGDIMFEALSSNVDDRTLHEVYLWPFANAVRANAASVMCSYQRLNGSYACQNSKLLNGILKDELGFQGYVISDWYATHSGVGAIEAGLDLDMPGRIRNRNVRLPEIDKFAAFFGGNITAMVNNGTLHESRLDDMITRIMTPYYYLHQDEGYPTIDASSVQLNTFSERNTWFRDDWNIDMNQPIRDVRENHAELIREIAAASTILLKNSKNALPLRSPRYIAVFGNSAGDVSNGPLNRFGSPETLEYGTLAVGGGSGAGRLGNLVTPLHAIQSRANQDGTLVEYWLNNTFIASSNVSSLWYSREPDVCLVFVKAWAREVIDRNDLNLGYHGNEVVESVARDCGNTIVISHTPGHANYPFADHSNVTAILSAHYPGEQSGPSIVDVLYGDINPSGKLPYTIAFNESDYNAPIVTNIQTNGTEDWQSWFDEGLEIDYRHFDAQNTSVQYEFGFGLSYTTFSMTDVEVRRAVSDTFTPISPLPQKLTVAPGGNPALWEVLYEASVSLQNTGVVRGSTVAQLYVSFPDSAPAGTPPRVLRGFEKIELAPGERRPVTFELMRRDVSYWDVFRQEWVIPQGDIRLSVGFSSRDLITSVTIDPLATSSKL